LDLSPFFSDAGIASTHHGITGVTTVSHSLRRFLILTAAIGVGAVIAGYCMSFLFPMVPSSMTRSRVILDALKEPSKPPSVCVFGNSVVMSGIDARQLSADLPGHPEVWNLSSGGQDLFEGFLYYQQLPETVNVIVHCIFACTLEHELVIDATKYNAFHMHGYRPNSTTREVTERFASFQAWHYMQRSDWRNRIESRWVLRSMIDVEIRGMLRRDIAVARATEDLYFPSIGDQKVPRDTFERQMHAITPPRGSPELRVPDETTGFLLRLDELCRARGATLVLVLLPRHPEFREYLGERFLRGLDRYCNRLRNQHGLAVINCIDIFGEDRFVDACHIDEVGARLFSANLASRSEILDACCSTRRNSLSSR
jgi:uncharacterized protein YjiS (DUF1127 family)